MTKDVSEISYRLFSHRYQYVITFFFSNNFFRNSNKKIVDNIIKDRLKSQGKYIFLSLSMTSSGIISIFSMISNSLKLVKG